MLSMNSVPSRCTMHLSFTKMWVSRKSRHGVQQLSLQAEWVGIQDGGVGCEGSFRRRSLRKNTWARRKERPAVTFLRAGAGEYMRSVE